MSDGRSRRWEPSKLLGYVLALSLMITLAVVTLMPRGPGGAVLAAGKGPKQAVTILTLTGSGSTEDESNFPNDNVEYPISLNGANTFTFTQPAGAAVELIVTQTDAESHWSNPSYPAAFCEGTVYVFDDSAPLGVRLDLLDQRGDHVGFPGYQTAMNGLAASSSDRTVTLSAIVRENDGCDDTNDDEPVADDDWWTVSIRVSVVILQG